MIFDGRLQSDSSLEGHHKIRNMISSIVQIKGLSTWRVIIDASCSCEPATPRNGLKMFDWSACDKRSSH